MDTNKIEQIKDVAIYLRKSRGEEEDLEKHKEELIDLCSYNNWKYTLYEEIGSSADIEYRSELKKLLHDIKEDLYDAVVVIDKDRLSREQSGQALINKTLIENNCLIITPSKIYDLSNDNDILMSEVEDLMARFEYRMTSKRFKRGKKRGAKMGNWVNGVPPFPYEYDSKTKSLIVNEENKKWYRFMVEEFLEGKPFYEIAWNLNKAGVKTKRGGRWYENSIRRLLLSEVHLGKVVYGKTSGSGHKNKKTKPLEYKSKEEWIMAEGLHEPLKTLEEHEQIFSTLSSRRRVPKTSRQIKLPLSGLLRCGKCNSSLQMQRRMNAKGKEVITIKTCQHADQYGNRCGNKGGKAEIVLNAIKTKMQEKISLLNEEIKKNINNREKEIEHFKLKQEAAQREIIKKQNNIERAYLAYEDGVIGLEKYKQRTEAIKKEIEKLKEQISSYDIMIKNISNEDKEEKLKQFLTLAQLLENTKEEHSDEDNKKINFHLKDVIYDIIWTRSEDDIKIEINFI